MAIKVPIVSEFNKTGLVQANAALARFGVTSQRELKKAGAGFALLAVGAAKAFSALDAGYDAIIVATGASGKALDGLKDDADAVARSVPNSFEEVGKAIGEVNTRLGLTGKPLQDMSKKFLDLARITKTDVTTNIANVTRVFGDWDIATEDQSLALDKLFAATKQTGIGLDRLTTLTVNYGAPLRGLGFDMEQSISIFAKWEKEGVNTEAVMAGMKIGLNKLAIAGKDPAKAFAELSKEMIAAKDITEATAIAAEVFGQRAGADMAAAVREGRFEIDDMVASLGDVEGALDDAAEATLSTNDHLKILANQIIVAVAPAVETLEKVTSLLTKGLGHLPKEVQSVVVILGVLAVASKSARAGMLAFAKSNDAATASSGRSKLAVGKMSKVLGVAAVAYGGYAAAQHAANETQQQFIANVGVLEEATNDAAVNGLGLMISTSKALKDGSPEEVFTKVADQSLAAAIRLRDLAAADAEYEATLAQTGLTVEMMTAAIEEEIDAQGRANAATDAATEALEGQTEATEDGIDTATEFTKAQKLVESAVEDAIDAYDGGTKSLEELEDAARAARLEARKLAGDHMTAEEATWDWIEAQDRLKTVMADEESTLIDVARQINNTIRATDEMVMANEGLTEESLATAAGMDAWTVGMRAAADEMSGRLKVETLEHIARVNGMAEEKITKFLVKPDAEAIRLMNVELAKLQAPRGVPYVPYARGRIPSFGGGNVAAATGGIVTQPTVSLIGEAGPEAVIPLNKTPGSSPLPGGLGGGGTTLNITVNTTGLGATSPEIEAAVIRAVQRAVKRNGPGVLQGITV